MKVTIDIPEALYRRLKAKAAADGRSVRDVTIEAYEAWLPPGPFASEEERLAAAEAWLAEFIRLGKELSAKLPPSDRSAVQILMDDRRAKDY